MKLLFVALAVSTTAATHAEGVEPSSKTLQLRPKSAIVESTPRHYQAPFLNPTVTEPELDLLPRRDLRQEQSRSSCNGEGALCYDPASGRIVYKPARQFMPDLPGFRPENISVKRDRIVFRYSF